MSIIIPCGDKKNSKTTFKGCPYYNLITMIYIECMFKKIATVIIPDINLNKTFNHRYLSLRWIQSKKNGYISVPKNFWKHFKNENKRFIVMPFGFNCDDVTGHSNYLVYDSEFRSMERFEPYGKPFKACLNPKDLDKKILELFRKNIGDDFIEEYYKPLDFSPVASFQKIQEKENEMTDDDPDGFCPVWCVWYIELRLSNPDVDRKELVQKAIKLLDKKKSYTCYIRGYANKLVEFSKLVK